MSAPRIFLSAPHMGGEEQALVAEAFDSGWLSTAGPAIDAFETELGARIGRHAVAVGSGTSALHLMYRLAGIGPGDEVVFPTETFIATVAPAVQLGARPVFVDSDAETFCLDPARLAPWLAARAARGALPRAIVPVHLYGQCADMDALLALGARYGVAVLEDAAEALGATFGGRPAGSLAPLAAVSFNGNKIITTTGGGALFAEDPAVAAKARHWATQAREPGRGYLHRELGYNYRLSNVLASIGRGQLRVLDARVEGRRAIFARYADAFADLPGLRPSVEAPYGVHNRWLSVFHVDEAALGLSRDALVEALEAANIEARPVFRPMHQQPVFADAERVGGEVADRHGREGICLPSSTRMCPDEQARVIAAVVDAVAAARGTPR